MSNEETPPFERAGLVRRFVRTWVGHRALDAVAAIPILIWGYLGYREWMPTLLTEVAPGARRAIFQSTLTVAGTMAGLTLTSVSILVNLLRTPLSNLDNILPASDKRRVGAVFLAALLPLLLTFIASASTIAIEGDAVMGVWWVEAITLFLATTSVLAIARIVWVLRRLLDLTAK